MWQLISQACIANIPRLDAQIEAWSEQADWAVEQKVIKMNGWILK